MAALEICLCQQAVALLRIRIMITDLAAGCCTVQLFEFGDCTITEKSVITEHKTVPEESGVVINSAECRLCEVLHQFSDSTLQNGVFPVQSLGDRTLYPDLNPFNSWLQRKAHADINKRGPHSHALPSSSGKRGLFPAFILKDALGHFLFVASRLVSLTQLVKQWPHRREVKLSIPQVIKAHYQCQRRVGRGASARVSLLYFTEVPSDRYCYLRFYPHPLWAGNDGVKVASIGMDSVSISKDVGLPGFCRDAGWHDGRALGYLKWSWASPLVKLAPFIVCEGKEDVASCGKPGAIGRNETGSGAVPHSK